MSKKELLQDVLNYTQSRRFKIDNTKIKNLEIISELSEIEFYIERLIENEDIHLAKK